MVGVERIVPIIKVSDLRTALNFYCSVLANRRVQRRGREHEEEPVEESRVSV